LGKKKLRQLKNYPIVVHKLDTNTMQPQHINMILMQLKLKKNIKYIIKNLAPKTRFFEVMQFNDVIKIYP